MDYCTFCFDSLEDKNDNLCEDCRKIVNLEGLDIKGDPTEEGFDHEGYMNHGDRDMDSFFYDGWD